MLIIFWFIISDFEEWKTKEEVENDFRFHTRTTKPKDGIWYFECSHSGEPKLAALPKNPTARKRSIKIGLTCPCSVVSYKLLYN